MLAAELTAGGRILLAELPKDVLAQLYLSPTGDSTGDGTGWGDRRLAPEQFEAFVRDLQSARAVGFAVNVEQTEEGVAAFGVAVRNRSGAAIGSITAAVPTTRYQTHSRGPLVSQLKAMVRELEVDVADIEP